MNIQLKSAAMELVPVEESTDAYPGSFHAIISSPKQDRDGDTLSPDEWEQPLPDHIVINGDHDNNHIMSTVGSGRPTLEPDNNIHVRGTFATTDYAQNVRKLASKGPNGEAPHLRSLSCAYREKETSKGVSRELVNASFVVVPSNTDCVLIDSKSFQPVDQTSKAKEFAKTVTKQLSDMTPADRTQAIHDLSSELGASCFSLMDDDAGAVEAKSTVPEVQKHYEELAKMGYHVTLKDASGNVITAEQISQTPQAPEESADRNGAPKENAAALDRLKAAALEMSTRAID
jgi:hypothetical protein